MLYRFTSKRRRAESRYGTLKERSVEALVVLFAVHTERPLEPLLSTRCRLPDRTLWFGRARLFEDRIELSGWTLRGRYGRTVALADVEEVEWWTGEEKVNFALHLKEGRSVPLHLRQAAGTWKFEVQERLDRRPLRALHPDAVSRRSAAA